MHAPEPAKGLNCHGEQADCEQRGGVATIRREVGETEHGPRILVQAVFLWH